ncbi:MAG: VOC family protein [Caulobacteraceae bacterium]|nr:VOC family protein [Caulobacteraceae bacterium]
MPSIPGQVVQNAFLVRDIDRAMDQWTRLVGAGPFFVGRDRDSSVLSLRGQPVLGATHVAVGQAGDVQIELFEILSERQGSGPQMFPMGEFGLHHVAIFSDDLIEAVAGYRRQGYDLAAEAEFGGDSRAAFIDTRADFGMFIEVYQDARFFRDFYAAVAAAAASWDGSDPVRSLDELTASVLAA